MPKSIASSGPSALLDLRFRRPMKDKSGDTPMRVTAQLMLWSPESIMMRATNLKNLELPELPPATGIDVSRANCHAQVHPLGRVGSRFISVRS